MKPSHFLSRVWQKSDPFFLNLIKQFVPTKANPFERWMRKTMGLKPFLHGHDRQVTENELSGFQASYKRQNLDAHMKEFSWHPDINSRN
jgi:hypothetical protein